MLFDLEQFDFKKSESTCPAVTIETPEDTRFPKIITRDFGDGCEGTTKVVRSDGREYLMNIREPLHRIQGCRWAQSGVKVIRFNLEEEEGTSANTEDEEAKYNHKVVIDYSYVGPEDSSCDSFVLRKVDDQEEAVVDLNR